MLVRKAISKPQTDTWAWVRERYIVYQVFYLMLKAKAIVRLVARFLMEMTIFFEVPSRSVGAREYASAKWTVVEKNKSSPRLGLGTMLGLLGQSLTCMGLHTKSWVRSLGTAWEGVRHLRPLGL